jgi:hypothetical protein
VSGVALKAAECGEVRSHVWATAALSVPAVVIFLASQEFTIDYVGVAGLTSLVVTSGLINLMRHRFPAPHLQRLFDTFELLALCSLFSLLACLATYAIAAATSGFADPMLAEADRMLGFDWVTMYHRVAGSLTLQVISEVSYIMIFGMPVVLMAGLGVTGNGRRGRVFLLGYGIALAISIGLFAAFPAGGPIGFFQIEGHYVPITNDDQRLIIEMLRDGKGRHIDLYALHGLVSFPSVHAASAILFTWGARPLPRLFVAFATINSLMLLSTPIQGNHYIVDLLAGLIIAGTAIALSEWLARRCGDRPPALAAPAGISTAPSVATTASGWTGSPPSK